MPRLFSPLRLRPTGQPAGYERRGTIRNTVNGSVNLNDNTLVDPDGNEYVTNTINGSFNCAGNSPAPQVGDSEGSPNQVNGRASGQCGGLVA